jgi:hemerythrin-like metal-binding protein
MSFVQWTDKLSVGNQAIDQDHQMLISYINDLHDAMTKGQGKEIVESILNKLVRYTHQHFTREEVLWSNGGYVGLAAHKMQHQKLLDSVDEFVRQFAKNDALLTIDLMNFLRDWLINHIQREDLTAAKALR